MKEGWEYKKLDEVCYVEYGTRVVQKKDGGTIYPVYGGGGETFRMDRFNRSDSIVIARFAMSKQCTRFVKGKFFLNDSGLTIRSKVDKIAQDFLNWHIIALNDEIYLLGKGMAQKNLDMPSFRNITLKIPPLSEQQHIVEELDLLSSIIEKKKAQLKELDNLAQSLFYEMFGDPITNEKGWEVKKLGEICSFSQGVQVDVSEQSTEKIPGWNRFLRIVDYTTDNDDIRYVNVNDPKFILNKDDIAMVRYGASVGTSDIGKEGVLANNLFKINYSKYVFNKYYLLYSFHTKYFKAFINTVSFGAAMPALSFKVIKDFQILQPPLSCQQSFATKIETIEHQKELIKQSIKEVETLFNSRMDYYFN